MKEAMSK